MIFFRILYVFFIVMNENLCVFCEKALDGSEGATILGEKGVRNILKCIEERGQGDSVHVRVGQKVHTECRRDFCHPKSILTHKRTLEDAASQRRDLRSEVPFSFETDCIFCGFGDTHNRKSGQGQGLISVMTLGFLPNLRTHIEQRDDSWANAVFRRINIVSDLPAAGAKYHRVCYSNFKLGGDIPRCFNTIPTDVCPQRKAAGRT